MFQCPRRFGVCVNRLKVGGSSLSSWRRRESNVRPQPSRVQRSPRRAWCALGSFFLSVTGGLFDGTDALGNATLAEALNRAEPLSKT